MCRFMLFIGLHAYSYTQKLDAKADRDMLANPSRIPYYLGFSREAGKFILVYKFSPKEEARHEVLHFLSIIEHIAFK